LQIILSAWVMLTGLVARKPTINNQYFLMKIFLTENEAA